MEDSEQRKKRLREMRTEADLAGGSSGGVEGFGIRGSVLSNPLLETPSTMPSPAAPRFNYYTDPMNAFSSEKRSNNANVQAPPPDYLPPPSFGASPMPRSNNANVQAAPPDYLPPPSFGGPPMPQFPSPRYDSMNRQMPPSPNQGLPTAYGNPVWNGPRGPPPHYNFPFHPAGGGAYPGPRFEPPRGPFYNNSAQGMNQWSNHNPNPSQGYRNSPNPGRGQGRGLGHNTGGHVSGRGNGRGSDSHGRWSNDRAGGADQFYKRSMIEDPWKYMEPVMWKATNRHTYTAYTPENSKPWTPSKSSSTKGEGSSSVFVKPNSGPSLAEYLAAALDEAANSEENV